MAATSHEHSAGREALSWYQAGCFVAAAFTVLTTCCCGASFLLDADVWRAYPSPESLAGVADLGDEHVPARPPTLHSDFDGDGTPDTLTTEYVHMEPLFRRATSGLVRVNSGADGSVLFARATLVPLPNATWFGDADGNGTDDALVPDGDARVFGRVVAR